MDQEPEAGDPVLHVEEGILRTDRCSCWSQPGARDGRSPSGERLSKTTLLEPDNLNLLLFAGFEMCVTWRCSVVCCELISHALPVTKFAPLSSEVLVPICCPALRYVPERTILWEILDTGERRLLQLIPCEKIAEILRAIHKHQKEVLLGLAKALVKVELTAVEARLNGVEFAEPADQDGSLHQKNSETEEQEQSGRAKWWQQSSPDGDARFVRDTAAEGPEPLENGWLELVAVRWLVGRGVIEPSIVTAFAGRRRRLSQV
ncbi:hypothetical protein T01_9046 [Trichinella spiralis]|uniref:Uncharacterized protein n=1 Tax=Trichinella spiralis TaxID=6334 RepID=A0A0V1AUK6_TRISP|nr:hypothetical protein T01_9046 [Trichinella spiralis]